MEGTKDANAAGTRGETEAQPTPRQEEATSDETLADLEETRADAATGKGGSAGAGGSTETSSPSPDGAPDSARGGRADGSDTGGPM